MLAMLQGHERQPLVRPRTSTCAFRLPRAISRPASLGPNPSPRNAAAARRSARRGPIGRSSEDPPPVVRRPHLGAGTHSVPSAQPVRQVRPVRSMYPVRPRRPVRLVRPVQGRVSRPQASRTPPVRRRRFRCRLLLHCPRPRALRPRACAPSRSLRWSRVRHGPGGRWPFPPRPRGTHSFLRRRLKRCPRPPARDPGSLCSRRRIRRRYVCAPSRSWPVRWPPSRPGPGIHSIPPVWPRGAARCRRCCPTRHASRHVRDSGCPRGVRGDSRVWWSARDPLPPARPNRRRRRRRPARSPPPLRRRPAVSATRGADGRRHGPGGSRRSALSRRGDGVRRCRCLAGVPSRRAGRHDGHAMTAAVTGTVASPAHHHRRTAFSRPW